MNFYCLQHLWKHNKCWKKTFIFVDVHYNGYVLTESFYINVDFFFLFCRPFWPKARRLGGMLVYQHSNPLTESGSLYSYTHTRARVSYPRAHATNKLAENVDSHRAVVFAACAAPGFADQLPTSNHTTTSRSSSFQSKLKGNPVFACLPIYRSS